MDYAALKKALQEFEPPEMNDGERMAEYMSGREVDFQPYSFLSADFAIANMFGYTVKQYLEDFDVKLEVLKRKREEFYQGSLDIGLGLKTMGTALGSIRVQPENGIDYIAQHFLTDYSLYDQLQIPDPYTNPELSKLLEDTKRTKETLPDFAFTASVAGPITTAIAVRPIEDILKDTRKRPEQLHKLLDLIVDSNLEWLKALKEVLGPIPTTFADPVACSDILSDKQFDEFSMPHFKRMVDGIEEIMGKCPGGHICGSSRKLWDKIAKAGVPSFSIDNCEDLSDAKEEFGDRMVLIGNVPPVDIIKEGSIDAVIAACKDSLLNGADSPKGFILSSGCQVPIGTPRENIEAFIYATRKYGRGARLGKLPQGILAQG